MHNAAKSPLASVLMVSPSRVSFTLTASNVESYNIWRARAARDSILARRQVHGATIARCMTNIKIWLGCALLLLGFGASAAPQNRAPAAGGTTWVTAWGTSQQVLSDTQITNATVRMIARVTIRGDSVRIRLDNTFGTEPVTIGRAYVGY